MAAQQPQARRYRFADLELDSGQKRLFRGADTIRLPRLSYEFLRVLVEAAPNLVPYGELAARVWGPRRTVTPENMTQRLLILRHSLGDDAVHPRYIESVRSQGCRLIPPVELATYDGARAWDPNGVRWSRLRRPLPGIVGAGIVGSIMLAGAVSWDRGDPDTATALAPTEQASTSIEPASRPPNSIAVLRFEKLNAEPEAAQYFAEAMHAELINELGKSEDLSVIARASMLHYGDGDRPMRIMADELQVSLIVAGSIRYEGERMHVIAELFDALTGIQLWSADYDVRPDDIFAVERGIASGIARALAVEPMDARPTEPGDIPTTSLEAFAFYMRAMDIFNENTLGSRTTAQTYLDQAIALDAEFAHAYAGKALIEAFAIISAGDAYERTTASIAEKEQVVRDLAATALALNPDTDLAYYALGILDLFSWRWREARQRFDRAIEISPQHAVFMSQLAWLEVCVLGENEMKGRVERAMALDPQNPYVHQLSGNVMECSGDLAGALAVTEKALKVDPTSFANRLSRAFRVARVQGPEAGLRALKDLEPLLTGQRVLSLPAVALAYRELGRPEEARRLFERLSAFADESRIGPANWYLAYLAVEDYDNAYRMLAQAVARPGPGPGFYTLVAFMLNPGEHPPFNEPRFLELRDRLRANR